MVPSRAAGGIGNSSSSSGIFYQGDGQAQHVGNSNITSSFGNSMNSIQGSARSNVAPVSMDVNNRVFNSIASPGPSVGASSIVTDANSGFSGGPHLQRSASINTESYMRVPASPLSFSSNNISLSGSSVMDGSSVVQQSSNHDPSSHQVQRSQQQGTSSATSLPTPRMGQVSLPSGARVQGSFIQEAYSMTQVQKKPRLDIKQDDILQQQFLQQLMQRQDPMLLTNQNPQFQALIQQQKLRQHQQLLQSMPPVQRAHLLQQQQQHQHQLQLRQQLQQQAVHPMSAINRPFDGGVCSRRIMQYLYHQRQRPSDNSIVYWRKFVSEYYSPRAKKRWCLSLYDNVGYHSLGVFPQSTKELWHCDICGSKTGKGFEATFDVLPRLAEIKFGSGIIDELLFLDMPREIRSPSGIMILEYAKAVQESVYEQLRVVREGQLRIIFAPDLKILSWEFCARHHEELLPRRLVAPQVNQLLHVAQKCQSTIAESGPEGVSQKDLLTNSNMVVTAGRQLARTLELQSLNDMGFSKKYVRCLQISEVVNIMDDLMKFIEQRNVGPIDGLKNFPRPHASAAKLQMQKMREFQQLATIQGLPTDQNTLYKLMALHPGLNGSSQMNNNHHPVGRGGAVTLNGGGPGQAAMSLSSYENQLKRKSMDSNSISLQQEASSSLSSPFHHQQQQQRLLSGNGLLQQNHMQQQPSQGSGQVLQQQMIQQLLQGMNNNSGGGGGGGMQQQQQQPPVISQNGSVVGVAGDGMGFGNNASATTVRRTDSNNGGLQSSGNGGPGSVTGPAQSSRSNSSKSAALNSGDYSSAGGGGGNNNGIINQKAAAAAELQHNLHLPEDMIQDIAHDFTENGFFSSDDLEEAMSYGWKD